MSARPPWRGTTTADVLVVDAPRLGADEARVRVLAAWTPGATLHLLPDGRWALVLAQPVRWRAEQAPGLPLRRAGDGTLTWTWHGTTHTAAVDALPVVPVDDWLDLSALTVEHLDPVEAAPPLPVAAQPAPDRTDVDLPAAAGVTRDPRAREVAAALAGKPFRRGTRGGEGARPGDGGPPRRNVLAELVLRAPTRGLVARRHARYLRGLSADLQARRYDEALRRAIALDGPGGRLSLRMPTPRTGPLRPRTGAASNGRALSVGGDDVDAHLRALYREAAARLEADGRIEEAAFVHADLLGAPLDAVRLLERAGRLELAATLAESRDLPPETAVRLWWRSGRRDRAVELARTRGAFAAVAGKLPAADDVAWRREWVRFCRESGDPAGAVRAAWPQDALRDEVAPELRRALTTGGPDVAEMFALALSHTPTAAALDLAESVLARPLTDDAAGRLRFVETLHEWPVEEPAADRRIATHAIRLLAREPAILGALPGPSRTRVVAGLRERADPLAVADLRIRQDAAPVVPATVALTFPGAGQVAVHDAAVTSSGVLLALGEHGARLCGPAGQVLARWDLPVDALVLADHGAAALLLVHGEASVEIHRLDLTTRTVRRWASLDVSRVVGSFDGSGVVAVTAAGIVLLDTTRPTVRELWRTRLGPGEVVVELARSATSLAAVIRADGSGELPAGLHLWRWSVPDLLLRGRDLVELPPEPVSSGALTAAGVLVTVHDGHFGPGTDVRHQGVHETPRTVSSQDGPLRVVPAGTRPAFLSATPDGVRAAGHEVHRASWSVALPGAGSVGVRITDGVPGPVATGTRHSGAGRTGVVVVWSADGRVVAFEPSTGRALARFATGT